MALASNPPAQLIAGQGSEGDDGRELTLVTEAVDCGGTERVLQTLANRFPAAQIVTNHFADLIDPSAAAWAAGAQLVPSGRRKRHFLAPLYARRLAAAPVAPARVVLTLVSGGWALAAPLPVGGRLLCYSTGLPPALYGEARLYLRNERALLRPFLWSALPALRAQYRRLMRRPDRLVTVSNSSAAALERLYGRQVEVIHPPVRTSFFTPAGVPRTHFLAVARLVPQKQLDVLIEAFRGLRETLVIVGSGALLGRLRAGAPPNVRLTGWVADTTLRQLYRSSRALLCPSVEDFGIVMAEAHACGVPVIAPRAGGACDIVDDPATGILLDAVRPQTVAAAVRGIARRHFDPEMCRTSAERFAEERFVTQMERVVSEELTAAGAGGWFGADDGVVCPVVAN
jgi:glycosyltransferase involved in cell wall biosynthesis